MSNKQLEQLAKQGLLDSFKEVWQTATTDERSIALQVATENDIFHIVEYILKRWDKRSVVKALGQIVPSYDQKTHMTYFERAMRKSQYQSIVLVMKHLQSHSSSLYTMRALKSIIDRADVFMIHALWEMENFAERFKSLWWIPLLVNTTEKINYELISLLATLCAQKFPELIPTMVSRLVPRNDKERIKKISKQEKDPIFMSVTQGDVEAFEQCFKETTAFKNGCPQNFIRRSTDKYTMLHLAILLDHWSIADRLLHWGFPMEEDDVYLAAEKGYVKGVAYYFTKFNLQVNHPHCAIISMYLVTVHTQFYNVINQAVSFSFFQAIVRPYFLKKCQ
jgi:hypothetical protein